MCPGIFVSHLPRALHRPSPVYGAPRAHAQLWPAARQEVRQSVQDGRSDRQGSDVLVDLLQLSDDGVGQQLENLMGKMEGYCCPLEEKSTD